jgi:isoleucyl-tRNA synthetase
VARAEKRIGASLQAHPVLHVSDAADLALLESVDMAEIAITSAFTLSSESPGPDGFTLPDVPGVAAVVALADGTKCERCWRVLAEVGSEPEHPGLCLRCADAVATLRRSTAAE